MKMKKLGSAKWDKYSGKKVIKIDVEDWEEFLIVNKNFNSLFLLPKGLFSKSFELLGLQDEITDENKTNKNFSDFTHLKALLGEFDSINVLFSQTQDSKLLYPWVSSFGMTLYFCLKYLVQNENFYLFRNYIQTNKKLDEATKNIVLKNLSEVEDFLGKTP